MGPIEANLIETLKVEAARLQNNSQLEKFERANAEFERLLREGLIKKRGYRLMTIESKHLHRVPISTF